MKIKAIGFDFDGTLIISEGSKRKIMVDTFSEHLNISLKNKKLIEKKYPELVGKGYSRKKKIEIIAERVLGRSISSTLKKNIAKSFGERYIQSMNSCPLFACNKLIKEINGQIDYMFILSLEEQKEVRKIAKHCNLSEYFDEINGGPKNKLENFNFLLKKWKLKPHEVIYVGDSHGDVIDAKKIGIKTILIDSEKTHKSLHKMLGVDFEVSSLCDIQSMFKNMKNNIFK